MTNQNWSRFPKTYMVASGLSDNRKVATLEELEEVIGLVLEGKLDELDSNSKAYRDILKLLEIIVHRDMPARALDPQSETGIYKLFESRTRFKDIMSAFHEANEKDKLVVSGKAVTAVEKFYIDYLWLESLIRSGLPLSDKLYDKSVINASDKILEEAVTNASDKIVEEAITNTSQHFSVAYYFLAQKDKFNRPEDPGLAPENALKALLVSAPKSQMSVSQEELVEQIVKRTEDEPTRSSLSHDYDRPFRHIPFGAYPSAALKVLSDVVHDPWIIFNTWSAAHGGWAYHEQIKQTARAVTDRVGSVGRGFPKRIL
jgi:hypothetical protein